MSEKLTIWLGQKLALNLHNEARETGLSKAEIVREALEARLKRRTKLPVMSRYLGVIASVPDLSSNKCYRRNWKQPSPG